MRNMITVLALILGVAATVPALANSGVDAKAQGQSTYSATAGAGGR